jgi:hypothetical protein
MCSHPFVRRTRPRVLMMLGVGGVHFDFVKMATGGVVGPKFFYNDCGDCSGEVPKPACAPIQECSGGYLNKVTEPGDWLSGTSIIVDMGATFL